MEARVKESFHQKEPALRVGYGDVRCISKEVT
jgi:hypothetical protein